jgi:DNA polymerase V
MKKNIFEKEKKLPEEEALAISGFPSPADDFSKRSLSLDDLIIENSSSTFYFKFSGEIQSSEADFNHGDILVVDRSKQLSPKTKYILTQDEEGFHVRSYLNMVKNIDKHKHKSYEKKSTEKIFGVIIALVRKFS